MSSRNSLVQGFGTATSFQAALPGEPDQMSPIRAADPFDLPVPEDIAEWKWSLVRWMKRVHDCSALELIIGLPVDDLLAQADWFEADEAMLLTPAAR